MTARAGTASPEPSRSSPSTDEELIGKLRLLANGGRFPAVPILIEAADRLESLLSDRAKLEEALADNAELRSERDALLQKPIDFAKLDSIDEDASGKMVAYYWWQQAQDARAALKDERA